MNHPVSQALAEASVVYFNIHAFASFAVAEQAELRGQLDAAVAAAVAEIDEEARIVLEAADGAAIIVLGAPLAALQAARARDAKRVSRRSALASITDRSKPTNACRPRFACTVTV